MKRFLFVIVFAVLLAACGPDRAQTIDPPVATPRPNPTATEPVTATQPAIAQEPLAPAPTASTQITESSDGIDEDRLLAALLTLDAMPTGWTGTAPEFELRTPGGTYTSLCHELEARSIAAVSVDFQKSAFGPLMSQTIAVYPNKTDAKAALDDLIAAARDCPELVDDAGNKSTFSALSFPAFGDDTFAIRSSGLVEMDIVQIRVDNVIINIIHGGLGAVDSTQTEEFVRAAVEKYR